MMIGIRTVSRVLGRIPSQYEAKIIRTLSVCNVTYHHQEINYSKLLNGKFSQNVTDSKNFRTVSVLYSELKEVLVPAFADSISEGDIRWIKAVGDYVQADEPVGEVETDKTSVPLNSPFAGVIVELMVEDGTTVTPGMKVCKIKPGEAPESGSQPAKAEPVKTESPPAPAATPVISKPSADIKAPIPTTPPPSPPIPKAPMQSIPVAAIKHSSFIHQAQVKVPPADYSKEITGTRTEQRVKMSRMRQRIAQRLKEAQNTNAMLTTFNEVDMGSLMELRKSVGETFLKKFGFKLGFMSAFIKASAYALQELPVCNAVIENQEIVYRDYVDISVAVATPKGLVVPVIRGVEAMNYADIERTIIGLGQKAKEGSLAVEDMDGGTFTISNGGVFGSMFGTPIINPPQSAILGMHGVFDRPMARNGQVVIRPMMYIALTYDHRLIDGREAVFFLRKVKSAVEDPRIMLCGL